MKFSVSQLLLLVALAALGIVLVREWNSPPIVWNSLVLSYTEPPVPASFDDKKRPPPKYQFGKDVKFEYSDGHSMYLEMHRKGWENAREAFYEDTELSLKRYPPIHPSDDSKWTVDHWHAGGDLGATQGADQIIALINESDEQSVRSSLAYHRNWHIIPICGLMVLILGGIAAFGFRNRRSRTASAGEPN